MARKKNIITTFTTWAWSLWTLPWTFRQIVALAHWMLALLFALGMLLPYFVELGWISPLQAAQARLLLAFPFLIAFVALSKLFERHRRLESKLAVTRAMLHGTTSA